MRQQINRWTLFHAVVLSTTVAMGAPLSADPFLARLELAVEIVDETGEAVPGSMVTASFRHTDKQRKKAGITKKFQEVYDGNTPVHFRYTSERNVALWVEKEGYWLSGVRYKFPEVDRVDERDGSPNGHYRKELTVVLREKINPRPLFVAKTKYKATRDFGSSMGYDLEIGDFVAPSGSGKVADLVFTLHQDKKDGGAYEHRLRLSFPRPGEGVLSVKKAAGSESKLLMGSSAPVEGYQPALDLMKGVKNTPKGLYVTQSPSKEEVQKTEGYWFRTRSREDPLTGEMTYRYGKISGPITFRVDEKGGAFYFTYFFSPNESRSLEWNGESLVPGANLQGVKKH